MRLLSDKAQAKAYEAGWDAREKGKSMDECPLQYGPNVTLVAIWQAGWQQKDQEIKSEKKEIGREAHG